MSSFAKCLIVILALASSSLGAEGMSLETALEELFATDVLLTVAGLKPITKVARPGSMDECLRVVTLALEDGRLANPDLRFGAGHHESIQNFQYDVDDNGLVTKVIPMQPHRFLKVMNHPALVKRLKTPVVQSLLREEPGGVEVPRSNVVDLIWTNANGSPVLAGIGYGFPARDVRAFRDEQRLAVRPRTPWRPTVGQAPPDIPNQSSHFRADRVRMWIDSADGRHQYLQSVTYGTQSKSAWARLRRGVRGVEHLRDLARARGVSNVDLFNHWPRITCDLRLTEGSSF